MNESAYARSAAFYDLIYGGNPYEEEAERVAGVEHFEEHHELGLFTREQMMDAFRSAGLEVVEHDPHGLTGRGLYVARQPG